MVSHTPPIRGVSQTLPVCTVSPPPQSPRLYARNCDVTALGLLSADVFECGGAIIRDATTSIYPVIGIHAYRRKCEFGEDTADGRRPHAIRDLKGPSLVECADDTAVVLNELRSDPERFSNHGRVGTKRGR